MHIMSALFFPILPFVLHMAIFAYWATTATYLYTWNRENCRRLGVPDHALDANSTQISNGTSCACSSIGTPKEPYCVFVNYTSDSQWVLYFQLYNLFGFFWALFFVDALCQLTLAGTFASYYWAFVKPQDVPAMPVVKAFYRAIRYHLGTMAFGALILAVVRMIRVMLEYVESKLKHANNPIAEFLMK